MYNFQALHLQKKKKSNLPIYVCVYLFPFLWELQKFIYQSTALLTLDGKTN